MLVEALSLSVPGIKFIQFNTDGITYIYKKQYEDKVKKICEWWQKTTQLNLEYAYYSKMVIRDVNNYTAQYTDGKLKKKGVFDVNLPFHKNPSMLIIPKALEAYFINGIEIEDFIKDENHSIHDFCIGVKKKSNFALNLVKNYNYAEIIEEQQKVCRFIITNDFKKGGKLIKYFNDGRKVGIATDGLVLPLDVIESEKASDYNIDYNWYIQQAKKIKELIKPSIIQTSLF